VPAPIYLDYNATTPVAPEVRRAIAPYLESLFGNPSSVHVHGSEAHRALELAREQVATLIGSASPEITFTSCATEANNLAILGVATALAEKKRHVILSAVEHPAVMAPALELRRLGWRVTIAAVDAQGRVDPDEIEAALEADTALVSIMHANNEVGTVQPIASIAERLRGRGVLLHTDAAQSAGKIGVNVDALGVDLLTLAGHKFYAPKGIGALYTRSGTPIRPLLFGGFQERSLRPGTENVACVVGLGAAANLARSNLATAPARMRELRDELHRSLETAIPGLELNGHPEERLPNTLNVSLPGVRAAELVDAVGQELCISAGAACHSSTAQPSGTLVAMGAATQRAASAVRISTGLYTSKAEVDEASRILTSAWKAQRRRF
jgi:cysteine desulfurase